MKFRQKTPEGPKRLPLKKCHDSVIDWVDKPNTGSIAEELERFRFKLVSTDELTVPDILKERHLAKMEEFDSLMLAYLNSKTWKKFMTSSFID